MRPKTQDSWDTKLETQKPKSKKQNSRPATYLRCEVKHLWPKILIARGTRDHGIGKGNARSGALLEIGKQCIRINNFSIGFKDISLGFQKGLVVATFFLCSFKLLLSFSLHKKSVCIICHIVNGNSYPWIRKCY